MKAVIAKRLLADLAPRAKPFEICDSKLPGLLVRVQPSGMMSYVCEYRRGKRVTIGRTELLTPVQARDRAKGILLEAAQGNDPQPEKTPKKAHTLKSFLDEGQKGQIYLEQISIQINLSPSVLDPCRSLRHLERIVSEIARTAV